MGQIGDTRVPGIVVWLLWGHLIPNCCAYHVTLCALCCVLCLSFRWIDKVKYRFFPNPWYLNITKLWYVFMFCGGIKVYGVGIIVVASWYWYHDTGILVLLWWYGIMVLAWLGSWYNRLAANSTDGHWHKSWPLIMSNSLKDMFRIQIQRWIYRHTHHHLWYHGHSMRSAMLWYYWGTGSESEHWTSAWMSQPIEPKQNTPFTF